ncbi:unnamed protein product [Cyclocybe aegerita]|uniref:Phytochrome n=1 Tax=Cyclocybe aegerita TaxID=1973307 RepID=A0A8S0WXT5_CYCAE|nr:unnamed protein product [Cyclocybe aegerita]
MWPAGYNTLDEEDVSIEPHLPFNLSEYGLVHLPPLPPTGSNSSRAPSTTSSGPRSGKSITTSDRNRLRKDELSSSSALTEANEIKDMAVRVTLPDTRPGSISSRQTGSDNALSGHAFSERSSSMASDEHYVSFKFQYREDDNGHHVAIGREGKLHRCEDEPIRTPGAVQGFGVLIAVDETEDTLVVRQVSENSTELLGLPPRYLFELECFTDTLPESQASVLWDHIQFLTEPQELEEEESTPHVFLLSGYGAPESVLPNEGDSEDGKRVWSCWCAVHRAHSSSGSLGLIVMEFELERDTLNPLYPPIPQQVSGVTSPATSQEGSSTEGSDRTLVESQLNPSNEHQNSDPFSLAGDCPNAMALANDAGTVIESSGYGFDRDECWRPTAEEIIDSTTSRAKPLPALERLRRMTRGIPSGAPGAPEVEPTGGGNSNGRDRRRRRRGQGGYAAVGMMDVFAVMAQINEQLGSAPNLDSFLKVVVGVIKDLTQFHRVLVYQFDELWNGQVVAELLDWSQSHDLYRGLHFPAGDIPAQARELYKINKVRILYDRAQCTARIVVRNKDDLESPLNMTYCYLRAMSPIHIQYLENMGVRASMSVSILAFGQLWGLITCHSYGIHGMRVSFPVRQMLRLLSQSISRNIERLSYAQRLHTRKLINTMVSENHPTGYIVSDADDLLSLFDADFGILVVGEGAKILGPNEHGQEILIMAEYLRLKQYDTIQASQAVINDFPDLQLTAGFEVIAGLLYVPLSSGGKDFIAFLRKGQPRQVHWAGKPYQEGKEKIAKLEPRKSFKIWSEIVAGRCKAWNDEQLETAGVLALVYGKFIDVWRQKENALQKTKLTNLLLSNASHEVRTPLNHIINYLEMALNGPLDVETRDNLSKSHAASKSLLFTINDLLDLTRMESGNETSFSEPFDLHFAIEEATCLYRKEAERRNIKFILDLQDSPKVVVGDAKKIRTVVQNLTANALKYTTSGSITVCCTTFGEPEGLRSTNQVAIEIIVADSGCGIAPEKLESIFREFEQVESSETRSNAIAGVGLGLAVVARIVEQLGGQLRVDSKLGEGSRFSFLIPLALSAGAASPLTGSSLSSQSSRSSPRIRSRPASFFSASGGKDVDSLVSALSSSHMSSPSRSEDIKPKEATRAKSRQLSSSGVFPVADSHIPVRPVKIDYFDQDIPFEDRKPTFPDPKIEIANVPRSFLPATPRRAFPEEESDSSILRVLVVEDNDINRTILAKRLTLNGYTVVNATNGQEGFDKVVADPTLDLILMDIQMPILDGFEATRRIRDFEEKEIKRNTASSVHRLSHTLNGRIPIFAVSASLLEDQREELVHHGVDGWILKPIDFKRFLNILKGVTDPEQRHRDAYRKGCNWEVGGWLQQHPGT